MTLRYCTPVVILSIMSPAPIVVAADYLDLDAAQKAVFPEADTFQQVIVNPSAAQLQAVLAHIAQKRRSSDILVRID